MIKKIIAEFANLSWTLGGTGLVLITLSGETQKWGIYISVMSLAVHMAGVLTNRGNQS